MHPFKKTNDYKSYILFRNHWFLFLIQTITLKSIHISNTSKHQFWSPDKLL